MSTVAGIRFVKAGTILEAEVRNVQLTLGGKVVVETAKGRHVGVVATVEEQEGKMGQGTVIRLATQQDLDLERRLIEDRASAMKRAQETIDHHGLPMKVLMVNWSLDKDYITITFWAEDRVDFRALVRDLARLFSARVELHQVGARERAKLTGGIGVCGRQLCCNLWQQEPPKVTVNMAREQALLQSIPELTGSCGRLLCCLRYEYQDYIEGKAEMPPPGEQVITPIGGGRVIRRDLMKGRVLVEFQNDKAQDFMAAEVRSLSAAEACGDCPEAV